MEVIAYEKYIRISPKKLRETSRKLAGMHPEKAIARLMFMSTKASRILSKVIKSALSNAVNTKKMDSTKLKIKSVEILKGSFFKRWNPVSRGTAHEIKKRTSHIKVVIEQKDMVEPQKIQKIKPSEATVTADTVKPEEFEKPKKTIKQTAVRKVRKE